MNWITEALGPKPRLPSRPRHITNLLKRKTPLSSEEQKQLDRYERKRDKIIIDRDRYNEDVEKLRLVKAEDKKIEQERKVRVKYKSIYGTLKECVGYDDTIDILERQLVGRCIANDIRDSGTIKYIGWESPDYKRSHRKTLDHIYPLQVAGEFIISHYMVTKDFQLDWYKKYIDVFCQVAKVTSEENDILGRGNYAPQSTQNFLHPEKAYEDADIELKFKKITRLESVAPRRVLRHYFGNRIKDFDKYIKKYSS